MRVDVGEAPVPANDNLMLARELVGGSPQGLEDVLGVLLLAADRQDLLLEPDPWPLSQWTSRTSFSFRSADDRLRHTSASY